MGGFVDILIMFYIRLWFSWFFGMVSLCCVVCVVLNDFIYLGGWEVFYGYWGGWGVFIGIGGFWWWERFVIILRECKLFEYFNF